MAVNKPKKHGGKRKGAGKPALFGVAMDRYNVILDKATVAKLKRHGGGNLSEGIRKAALIITERR